MFIFVLFQIKRKMEIDRKHIKTEIQRIIEKVPDDALAQIYAVLKDFSIKNNDPVKLSHNLNKILTEDKRLLERLAK